MFFGKKKNTARGAEKTPSKEMTQAQPLKRINICILGDNGHGKTTLKNVITENGILGPDVPEYGMDSDIEKLRNAKDTAMQIYEGLDNIERIDAAIYVVDITQGPSSAFEKNIEAVYKSASEDADIPVFVFLNKKDLVGDEELIDFIEDEVRERLEQLPYIGLRFQIFRGSAKMAEEEGRELLSPIIRLCDNLRNIVGN